MIVRGNHIRNAAFSAIRGNAASNIQIIGNNCSALDEVAIYSEFEFEGAVIADNVIDGAGRPEFPSPISTKAAGSPRCAAISCAICGARIAGTGRRRRQASASASKPTPRSPAT